MNDQPAKATHPKPNNPIFRLAGPILLVLILGGASLYAFGGWSNRPIGASVEIAGQNAACPSAKAVAERLKPLIKGEIAALTVSDQPTPLRDLTFLNPQGTEITLASLRGKTILLNLWATWCPPCRHEMPALDRLQGEFGGPDFEVVAVNIDTRNFDKPKQFLNEINVKNLGYYADPSARIFQDLKSVGKAFGMPTTILLDKNGCELATLNGPAEWAGAEAMALIRAALNRL
jgi:thiol-disulfide isomerase/thioredoxin